MSTREGCRSCKMTAAGEHQGNCIDRPFEPAALDEWYRPYPEKEWLPRGWRYSWKRGTWR